MLLHVRGLPAVAHRGIFDFLAPFCLMDYFEGVVHVAFSGHHHAGAFGYYKNIPLITLEGMVETENQNAYAIVEISQDHLLVKGQGRASSYSFKLSRQ